MGRFRICKGKLKKLALISGREFLRSCRDRRPRRSVTKANLILWRRWGRGGRSQFAKQIDAERLGFPKTNTASFWGSQRQRGEPHFLRQLLFGMVRAVEAPAPTNDRRRRKNNFLFPLGKFLRGYRGTFFKKFPYIVLPTPHAKTAPLSAEDTSLA